MLYKARGLLRGPAVEAPLNLTVRVFPCKLQSELERRCLPNLMTRFREEHYATRAHKAFTRRARASYGVTRPDTGSCWQEYFQKPLSVRTAIRKAQKASAGQGRLI